MAGASSREAIDVSTAIKKNFTCRICLDDYKDPRGLPCQHAFCCECLERYIISSVEEGKKNFKCPLCKRTTRPPNTKKPKQTWANQFKPDFKLTSIRDELQQLAIDVSTAIKKNFTCRICQDNYKDPRGLPCQHAFCFTCLERHIISSVDEGKKYFKCPLCKRRTRSSYPNKPKQTWANQFKPDFKLTSIRDELQQLVAETALESEAVYDAAATTVSTSTVSTSKIPQTGMQHAPNPRQQPRHVPSAASQNIAIISPWGDTEWIQYRDIPYGSIFETTDTKVLKDDGGDNSNQAISGSVKKWIDLATGDEVSYDLTVLVQGEKRIILAPNFKEKSLLAITLNPRLEEVSRWPVNLKATPIRICHLDNSVVALTTSDPNAIALYRWQDELLFEKQIQTKKAYDGIACLEKGLFVVTTGTDVDIVDRNGIVLAEHKVTMPNVFQPDNCYVSVTPGGQMVITDISGPALTCLSRDFQLFWQNEKKKKIYEYPMGTAVDSNGAIFVADHTSEAVLQLNTKGSLVCNVVEKSEHFRKPSGVALDNMGFMYVICDYYFVSVVKLSNCDS